MRIVRKVSAYYKRIYIYKELREGVKGFRG